MRAILLKSSDIFVTNQGFRQRLPLHGGAGRFLRVAHQRSLPQEVSGLVQLRHSLLFYLRCLLVFFVGIHFHEVSLSLPAQLAQIWGSGVRLAENG